VLRVHDVVTEAPIAIRPGNGSVETTVVGISLNSGCPPAASGAEVAFQGSTSFCAVATSHLCEWLKASSIEVAREYPHGCRLEPLSVTNVVAGEHQNDPGEPQACGLASRRADKARLDLTPSSLQCLGKNDKCLRRMRSGLNELTGLHGNSPIRMSNSTGRLPRTLEGDASLPHERYMGSRRNVQSKQNSAAQIDRMLSLTCGAGGQAALAANDNAPLFLRTALN
jgi:hypothetical protein